MKIAIVQDGPEYLNLNYTLEKTIDFIQDAKKEKADLTVFGECWMSGYPAWLDVCSDVGLWDHGPVKEVWGRTYESALSAESETMKTLKRVIKENQIYVVLGANEVIRSGRGNGTIYNSVFTFSRDGEILNHHRKLMPTHTERMVYGLGDGFGLKAVETSFGRLGSLICWEHWMPLARQEMHNEAEDLHIALWPMVKEMNQVASRQYAFEGRCTVVAVGQIMTFEKIPSELEVSPSIMRTSDDLVLRGGSSIYGPDGSVILEPVYDKREIIYVDLNLSKNKVEKMNLAVSGHYQREDIFSFSSNKKRII